MTITGKIDLSISENQAYFAAQWASGISQIALARQCGLKNSTPICKAISLFIRAWSPEDLVVDDGYESWRVLGRVNGNQGERRKAFIGPALNNFILSRSGCAPRIGSRFSEDEAFAIENAPVRREFRELVGTMARGLFVVARYKGNRAAYVAKILDVSISCIEMLGLSSGDFRINSDGVIEKTRINGAFFNGSFFS
jgi:hypothetical protein